MYLPLSGLYRFDEFELDPQRRALTRNGLPIPLSPKAFDVLSFLVANAGRAIPKDEILQAVWSGSYVEEGNLAQHISTLRKAMADRAGSCITTLPGRGYQFTAVVETEYAVDTLPESRSGDVYVQTVRERTNYVIERVAQAPVPQPLALAAPRPRTRLCRPGGWGGACAGWPVGLHPLHSPASVAETRRQRLQQRHGRRDL